MAFLADIARLYRGGDSGSDEDDSGYGRRSGGGSGAEPTVASLLAKRKKDPVVALDADVLEVLRAAARKAQADGPDTNEWRGADERVLDATSTQADALLDDDGAAFPLFPYASTARGGWFGVDSEGDRFHFDTPPVLNRAAALTPFHCALLVRSALFVRNNLALIRKHARVSTAKAQRSRVAAENSTEVDAETPTVPAVVGIALGSNFAMLKSLAAKHPDRCRQALGVLTKILSSLDPLALRNQKQTEELNQLQGFLAQLAAAPPATAATAADAKSAAAATASPTAAAPAAAAETPNLSGVDRGGSLEAMLSLALTRGTMESTLSAANSLLNAQCPAGMPTILKELLDRLQPPRLSPPSRATLASEFALAAAVDYGKSGDAAAAAAADGKAEMPCSVATYQSYLYVYCQSGLWKVGTGHGGTVAGKTYGHNPAVAVKFPRERSWLMAVDSHLYLRSTTLASGELFKVMSGETLAEIGVIRQDGKGLIPSDNNSGYSVLGPVTDNRGPVFTDGTYIYALEVKVEAASAKDNTPDAERDITLSVTQFTKTGLRFLSVVELAGPSRYGGLRAKASAGAPPLDARTKKAMKEATAFVMGQNNCGELALGNNSSQSRPAALTRTHHATVKAKWASVKCAYETTFFTSTTGAVYAVGMNSNGQLGNGGQQNTSTLQRVRIPNDIAVVSVASARNGRHSLFLTAGGDVYACGEYANGQLGLGSELVRNGRNVTTPELVNKDRAVFDGQRVVYICCDYQKSGFLTADGSAWSCGYDYVGAIGHGGAAANNYSHHTPKKIVLPGADADRRFKQIAMGYTHTQLLTTDGVVWSMGQNSYGQLGLGHRNNAQTPQKVTQFGPASGGTGASRTAPKVKSIDSAYYHSICVTEDDDAFYVCGYNGHGQLGNGSASGDATTYQGVQALSGKRVASASCGSYGNAVLLQTGECYTWGNSSYGELGHQSTGTQYTPKRIDFFPDNGITVRGFSMGQCHSVALVAAAEPPISVDAFKSSAWIGGPGYVAALLPPGMRFTDRKAADDGGGAAVTRFDAKESGARVFALDSGAHVLDKGCGSRVPPYAVFSAAHQRTYVVDPTARAVASFFNLNLAIRPVEDTLPRVLSNTAQWSAEAILTHPLFAVSELDPRTRSESETVGVAMLACLEVLAQSYLVDPYEPTSFAGSDFMRNLSVASDAAAAAERRAKLFARALCVGTNTAAFGSLLGLLGGLWASIDASLATLQQSSASAAVEPAAATDRSGKLALAKVYALIATLRLLLLNLKLVLARPNGALDLSAQTMRQLRELIQTIVAAPFPTVPAATPGVADDAGANTASPAQRAVFAIRHIAGKVLETGFEAFLNTAAAKAEFVISLLATDAPAAAAADSKQASAPVGSLNVTAATTAMLETCVDILVAGPGVSDLVLVNAAEIDPDADPEPEQPATPSKASTPAAKDAKSPTAAAARGRAQTPPKAAPKGKPRRAVAAMIAGMIRGGDAKADAKADAKPAAAAASNAQKKTPTKKGATPEAPAAPAAPAVAEATNASNADRDDLRWRTLPLLLKSLAAHTEAAIEAGGELKASAEQQSLVVRHQRAVVRLLNAIQLELFRSAALAPNSPTEKRQFGTLIAFGTQVLAHVRGLIARFDAARASLAKPHARALVNRCPLFRSVLPQWLAALRPFSASPVLASTLVPDLTDVLRQLSALGAAIELVATASDAEAETVVVESPHPYTPGTFLRQRVALPSDVFCLVVEFDARSQTAQYHDSLTLRAADPDTGVERDLYGAIRGPTGRATGRAFRNRSWVVPGHECVFQLSTAAPVAGDAANPEAAAPAAGAWGWTVVGNNNAEASAKYTLSELNRYASRKTGGAADSYLAGSFAMSQGVHTWEVAVTGASDYNKRQIVIGVAPDDHPPTAHASCMGVVVSGSTLGGVRQKRQFSGFDRVTVTLDFDANKVTFGNGGSDVFAEGTIGSNWRDRKLVPVVWLMHADSTARVSFPAPSAPTAPTAPTPSDKADRIARLKALNSEDDAKAAAAQALSVADAKVAVEPVTAADMAKRYGFRAYVTGYRSGTKAVGGDAQWFGRLLNDVTSWCALVLSHAFAKPLTGLGTHLALVDSVLLTPGLTLPGGTPPPDPLSAADRSFLTALTDSAADSRLLRWIIAHVTSPDPKQTVASGANVTRGTLGAPASFTVSVRDQFGQPIGAPSTAASSADAAAAEEVKRAPSGVKVTAELFEATKKVLALPDYTKPITWKASTALPTTVAQLTPCATRDGSQVYLFGGWSANSEQSHTYLYDQKTKAFTIKAKLPTANRGMGACLLPDDTILLAGGTRACLYIYDPKKNTFKTPGTAKNLGWGTQVVCDSKGKAWAFGGENDGKNKLWSYDPKLDRWVNVGQLLNDMKCHGACIDERDIIFAYGGTPQSQKVYRCDTRALPIKWQALTQAPKSLVQFGHALITSGDGAAGKQIVVVGGSSTATNNTSPYYNDVYTYTVATDRWTVNPNKLPQALRECAMVRMANNELHVFGGYTGYTSSSHFVGTPQNNDSAKDDGAGRTGPRLRFDVTENADGSFACAVKQPLAVPAGEYYLAVQVDGQHIRGSPFTWTCEPAGGAAAATATDVKTPTTPNAATAAAAIAAPDPVIGDDDDGLAAALAASAAAMNPAPATPAKSAAAPAASATPAAVTTTTTTTATASPVMSPAAAFSATAAMEKEAAEQRNDQLKLEDLQRRFKVKVWKQLTKQLASARDDKKAELRAQLAPYDRMKKQIEELESKLALDITFGGDKPVGGLGFGAAAGASASSADAKSAAGSIDASGYRTEKLSRPESLVPSLNTPSVYSTKLTLFAALVKHLALLGTAQGADQALAKAGAATAAVADSPLLYALWRTVNNRLNRYVSDAYLRDDRRKSRAAARKHNPKSAEPDEFADDPFEPYCESIARNAQVILDLAPAYATTPAELLAPVTGAGAAAAADSKDQKQAAAPAVPLATQIDVYAARLAQQKAVDAVLDNALLKGKALSLAPIQLEVSERELRAERMIGAYEQLNALLAAVTPAAAGNEPLPAAALAHTHTLVNASLSFASFTRERDADAQPRANIEHPANVVNGVCADTRAALSAAYLAVLQRVASIAAQSAGAKGVNPRFTLSALRALNCELDAAERQQLAKAVPTLAAALKTVADAKGAPAGPLSDPELSPVAVAATAGGVSPWAWDFPRGADALASPGAAAALWSAPDLLGAAKVTASGNTPDLKLLADGNPSTFWASSKAAYSYSSSSTSWLQFEFPSLAAVAAVALYVDGPRGDYAQLPKELVVTATRQAYDSKKADAALGFAPVATLPVVDARDAKWLVVAPANGQVFAARCLRLVFEGKNQARVRMLKIVGAETPRLLPRFDVQNLVADAAAAALNAAAAK